MEASIRGTKIYFDVAGMQIAPKGNIKNNNFVERPVLFLLHGGPGGDHLRFKQFSLELQNHAQLIFIDHRGCGRSKKTKITDYTLKNNIEDIEALRKYLGLKRISILGTSYGGIVAQGYAIRYGKNIDKLILVATTPSYHTIDEAKKILRLRGSKQQIAMAENLWNGNFKNSQHVIEFFQSLNSIYSVKAKKQQKNRYSKTQTVWSHQALNHAFKTFMQTFNFIPHLKKIKSPTLILAGDQDWICPPSQARIIASKIPNSQLKIFKKCGHAISVDAHDQYIKSIINFLKHKN